MDRPISLNEAAEHAGVTPGALRIAARSGALVAQKIGRDWVVTQQAVTDYLEHRRGGVGRKPYGSGQKQEGKRNGNEGRLRDQE